MDLGASILAAHWLNVALFATVAFHLRFQGLHHRYRVFFWYLLFSTCRSAALLALDRSTSGYFWMWLTTEPALWIFNVLLVRELFSLVLSHHPGLGRLGKWLFQGALLTGIAVSAISLLAQGTEKPGQSLTLLAMFLVTRCIAVTVLVFLLALVAFLNWYPVSLSHNVVRHAIVFAVYFLSITVGYLARVLAGNQFMDWVNLFL